MSENKNQNVSEDVKKVKTKKTLAVFVSSCIGIVIASGIGTWIGIDNVGVCTGIGVAIGVGVGLAVGNRIENKNK